MKRLWILLLAALLLLAGCKKQPPAPENTEATDPAKLSLYVPDSPVEQATAGAVRMYKLPEDTYFDITGVGTNVLALGQKGLTLLAGERAEVVATLETGEITPLSVLDTHATGFAYYSPNTRLVNVLNPQLQTVTQLVLPNTVVGNPVISLAKYEVYYSTGTEIRALNMNTGISRLLRQQTVAKLTLLGAYFGGDVLLCRFVNETGTAQLAYISTQTGQTLNGGQGISHLQTNGADYFAYWLDGTVRQMVFGTRGGASKSFLAPAIAEDKVGGRVALPAMGGIVDYLETENGLELSYYDLNTGKKTSQIVIPGMKTPTKLHSDGANIWILTADQENALYRWELSKSRLQEETVYTGPLYTAQNPDTQGLAQSRQLADDYQKQYGVKLLFWQDAVAHTGGYTLVAEHKTQVINQFLADIQPVLAHFPDKFLLKTVEKGWLQIAFVQSIDGDKDWVQFWEDGDCWILISAKADAAKALIQGMAYGIDSHVLGNSRKYDTWNQLNPKIFSYSAANTAETMVRFLEAATRAFTDAQATTYPHEDRCRVFYNAMLPDNGEMFASPIMKEKLLRVCTAIREAYGLEKKTETYIWEQYLDTSLAYVEG